MASFSSSAFSTDAFSELAFDFGTAPPASDVEYLGGGGYVHPYVKYKDEEYRREKEAELRRVEQELTQAEQERLAQENASIEARSVFDFGALLEEINKLRTRRAWLMRILDDEEAIAVLMLANPFH